MTTLVPARFVARPNRFIVLARLRDGSEARCHLADPGRLRDLLIPGAELRLASAEHRPGRRTRWTVALVRAPVARGLLADGRIPGLGKGLEVLREVRHGKSRIDFCVVGPRGARTLVEVKSVSLVEGGRALFPDAPTVRGARHVRELTAHVRKGGRAMILFVVQRPDARSVSPNPRTDPAFTAALGEAREAGVMLRAVGFRFNAAGRARLSGFVPVR